MSLNTALVLLVYSGLLILTGTKSENPCAARRIKGESVICVCNETYCDEIIRKPPSKGEYVAYTSSQAGRRFEVTRGKLEQTTSGKKYTNTLTLNPNKTYQRIEGFGGAVTDAAGINWKNTSDILQKYLIESYFGDNGLQYNMIRVPIGGSDFSTHAYAYNDLPRDDSQLSNYSLTYEDYQYKIPMIKSIMNASSTPVHIVATTWSPPVWMKSNNDFYGFSHLKKEYYQTYALYHLKFLQKYSEQGIPIWAITTTNEPINGVIPVSRFNSLGWSASNMGQWISNNLGPMIRNSTFKDIKILALDDQRYTIPFEFMKMVKEHPKVLDYIDGVAVHYYGDFLTPASVLSQITDAYPNLFILATEASEGAFPWQKRIVYGSWDRAQTYISDILTDLNQNLVGWMDWNLCLNTLGGPNWANNFIDSPIIVNPEKNEFIKQPMFYAMGHFSKFIPRGSQRIDVDQKKCLLSFSVENVAFLTPHDTIVVVLHNRHSERTVVVKLGNREMTFNMEANSVTTVEISYTASERD